MRKMLTIIALATIITIQYGNANAGQNNTARFNEVKVVVNKSRNLMMMSAYEWNNEQYVRLNEICQAVDFYTLFEDSQNAVWINTARGYDSLSNFLCPSQNIIAIKPVNIKLYCNYILYGNVPSITVNGDCYIRISDIVDATCEASKYFDTTKSLPQIILLESKESSAIIPASFKNRYLTKYYDETTGTIQLSVVYKEIIMHSISDNSGGNEFIPIYPGKSQTIPLSQN